MDRSYCGWANWELLQVLIIKPTRTFPADFVQKWIKHGNRNEIPVKEFGRSDYAIFNPNTLKICSTDGRMDK